MAHHSHAWAVGGSSGRKIINERLGKIKHKNATNFLDCGSPYWIPRTLAANDTRQLRLSLESERSRVPSHVM